MQQITHGPGDAATWGPITNSADPRYDGRDDARDEQAKAALLRHRLCCPVYVSDAQAGFTNAECEALNAAIVECFAADSDEIDVDRLAEVGRVITTAVARVISRGVELDAEHDVARHRRERIGC